MNSLTFSAAEEPTVPVVGVVPDQLKRYSRGRLPVWKPYVAVPRAPRAMTVRYLLRPTSGLVYGWGRGEVDRLYRRKAVLSRSQTLRIVPGFELTLPLPKEAIEGQTEEQWRRAGRKFPF